MVNSSEIEVKAVVALEAIVFKKCDMQVINEVEVKEYDSEMLNEVPDLVGYIVQRMILCGILQNLILQQ